MDKTTSLRRHIRVLPYLITLLLAPPLGAATVNETYTPPQPPDQLYGELFTAVQQAQLFDDQKTFADAVAKRAPADILALYKQQRDQSDFSLKAFVKANFTLPQARGGYQPKANQSLREHINELWPVLTQTAHVKGDYDSLLPLPNPYVIPGGRFREVYYWDSYFTMLGLAESDEWNKVRDMADNFAWELDQYGLIPNGNRSYYLSRSQPPFFSMMVELLAQHDGDAIYQHYLPQLQKEYNYWMRGQYQLQPGTAGKRVVKLADGAVLNRYWDARDEPRTESWLQDVTTANHVAKDQRPQLYRDLRSGAASGWDFSSRWFADGHSLSTIQTTQLLPVDLNSLLYHLEQTLAKGYQQAGDTQQAKHYKQVAEQRKKAINHYLWNKETGWYSDYNWQREQPRTQLTAAALFPLYLHLATQAHATQTAQAVEAQLVKPGGIVTTTKNTGQQWDAPNGWAPLQWVAVKGLANYQQNQLSRKVGLRFLGNVQATYDAKHKLVEKYVVDGKTLGGGSGGEYPLQDGFGWTNGVTLMLLDRYCPTHKTCNNAQDIPALSHPQ